MRKVAETGAPDGMIYHEGNVYLADLEKQAAQYLTPSLDLRTLVKGEVVNWADTFSIITVRFTIPTARYKMRVMM